MGATLNLKVIRQVVILVGGRGTRLGEITRDIPKPLVAIDSGKPFLEYLLEWVARHGYEKIILLAGHFGEKFEAIYDGRRIGMSQIRVLRETSPLGTAGALTTARDELDDYFIMMNGDAMFDINLRALEQFAMLQAATATLALRKVPDCSRYGRVIEQDGSVTAYFEKDVTHIGPGVINGGVYVLRREILDLIDELPSSMEQAIFPELVRLGKLAGRAFHGYFLDIGLPETLEIGRSELSGTRVKAAVFLDRDGVINVDEGYTYKPETLRFVDGAPQAIRRLNDMGYYVFVVTNQSGVARGYYTLKDVDRFHRKVQDRLAIQGAHIDCFYVAPYHPDGIISGFNIEHSDRKPNPGMLLRAMDEWPIIKDRSFLIGDKASDVDAAKGANVQGYLFDGKNLDDFVQAILSASDASSVPV